MVCAILLFALASERSLGLYGRHYEDEVLLQVKDWHLGCSLSRRDALRRRWWSVRAATAQALYTSVRKRREMRGNGFEKRIRRPSQGSNVRGQVNFKSEYRKGRGYAPGSSGSWSYGVADDQPTLRAAAVMAALGCIGWWLASCRG